MTVRDGVEHSVRASKGESSRTYSQILAKSITPPTKNENKLGERSQQICGYLELCKGNSFGLAIGNWEVSDATVVAGWNYAPTAHATCGKSLMRYIWVVYKDLPSYLLQICYSLQLQDHVSETRTVACWLHLLMSDSHLTYCSYRNYDRKLMGSTPFTHGTKRPSQYHWCYELYNPMLRGFLSRTISHRLLRSHQNHPIDTKCKH